MWYYNLNPMNWEEWVKVKDVTFNKELQLSMNCIGIFLIFNGDWVRSGTKESFRGDFLSNVLSVWGILDPDLLLLYRILRDSGSCSFDFCTGSWGILDPEVFILPGILGDLGSWNCFCVGYWGSWILEGWICMGSYGVLDPDILIWCRIQGDPGSCNFVSALDLLDPGSWSLGIVWDLGGLDLDIWPRHNPATRDPERPPGATAGPTRDPGDRQDPPRGLRGTVRDHRWSDHGIST